MFINAGLSPVLKVSSGLNQVFLVLHGAFLMLDKHLVNQSWRVKLSYTAVSSQLAQAKLAFLAELDDCTIQDLLADNSDLLILLGRP